MLPGWRAGGRIVASATVPAISRPGTRAAIRSLIVMHCFVFSIREGCPLGCLWVSYSRRSATSSAQSGRLRIACSTTFLASKLVRNPGKLRRRLLGVWISRPGSPSACQTGNAAPGVLAQNAFRNDCQLLRESSSFEENRGTKATCRQLAQLFSDTPEIVPQQAESAPGGELAVLWPLSYRIGPNSLFFTLSSRSNSYISSRSRKDTDRSGPLLEPPDGVK